MTSQNLFPFTPFIPPTLKSRLYLQLLNLLVRAVQLSPGKRLV